MSSSPLYARRTPICGARASSSRPLRFFCPGARPHPATVLRLIDEHQHRFGAEPVLRELHIPRLPLPPLALRVHEPCERRRYDAELTGRIHYIHAAFRREVTHVGRKRVEPLMRQACLQGVSPRRPPLVHPPRPTDDLTPDLVQRDFTADAPNRL
ncbi:IS3 family transposase [Kitasatospora sp. NBC_01250]|uniref:IS3 family transposase n=1 Tax=Kitasatospora sp. NBC_01250 TaxID=2903571 RepID=UPI003FA5FF74